ncbi:hypothetical protein, partial [Escherichia coli]|uniref:hypothetical protein n=1 Tax=Escherichia coli TaxID=562 RepID=UPI001BFED5A0
GRTISSAEIATGPIATKTFQMVDFTGIKKRLVFGPFSSLSTIQFTGSRTTEIAYGKRNKR